MLTEIKKALRISHTSLDDDISSNIDTALLDMSRIGVDVTDVTNTSTNANKLIVKACEFYCKWIYDYQGKGDSWRVAYENLRNAMSLCSLYNGGDSDE